MNNLVPAPATNVSPVELVGYSSPPVTPTPFERVRAMIYRQRWLGLAVFLTVVLLGALLTFTTSPRYTAVASVQLDQQTPRVINDPDLDPAPAPGDADRFLQTQLDRVRSRSLAEDVANALQIEKSPALLKALGVPAAAPADERHGRAVNKLQQNVGAALGLNTRLAQIQFTSLDPIASARIANAYADALAAANLNTKVSTASKAKQYLLGQLSSAKARLEGSERRMLAYARAADLTATIAPTTNPDGGGSLRAQQVGTLTDSLSQAMARRIDAQQQWQQVSGTSALQLPDVQNNKAVQDLYAQKAQLEAALQEDRQRHTDEYPSVRETAAKIQQLDREIGTLAANIKSSFYGRYMAALQQEQQLAGTLGRLRGSAMAERERSVGFNSLKREVETNKAFYDGLLQRYKEVAAASGAPSANVTVLDRAAPPVEPSSPNVERNMALASIAGLIFALVAGAAREGMHRPVRSAEDIEQAFNLPALGVVPLQHGQTATDFRLTSWRSTQAEAYHSIAVALEQASAGVLPKTLLITSSSASEGKSTTAVGIARSLSAMGKRVLLVDGDLRHPSLLNFTGQDDGPGLSDVLVGSVQAHQTIQRNDDDGFDVIPAGEARSSPVALLAKPQIQEMLHQLSADYDIVIIDGPPVMGLADAVLLARSVESILVVVEANRLHWSQVDVALSRLPADVIVGSVVTKFNAKAAGVRYGGTDYYSY
jgi:capsular exopolysaccharide synthesis family protein